MKTLITSAFLSISFSAFCQSMFPYAIKYQTAPDNVWLDFDSTYITYTAGLKTQEDQYYYFDSTWTFSQKTTFTHTAFDSVDLEMHYLWEDGTYYDSVRITHEYDDENYLLNQIYFIWYGGAWHINYETFLTYFFDYDDFHRFNYKYYSCTKKEEFEYTDFDSVEHYMSYSYMPDCIEDPEYNNYFTYNAAHKKEFLLSQLYDYGSWSFLDFARIYYYYDAEDDLDSTVLQQISGTDWFNFSKDLYDYNDAGLLTVHVQQAATDTGWLNTYETLNSYDAENRLTESVELYWDAGAWQKSRRLYYNYDTPGRLLEYGYQVFVVSEWTNYFRYLYYYDDSDTTELLLTDMNKDIAAWPNPFNTELRFNLPPENYTVRIYDIAGSVLFTGTFTGSNYIFNNTNSFLSPGIYIAQFTSDRGNIYNARIMCEK